MGSDLSKSAGPTDDKAISTRGLAEKNDLSNEPVISNDREGVQDSEYQSVVDDEEEGDHYRILPNYNMDPKRPRKLESQGLNQAKEKRPGLLAKWLPSWFDRYKKVGISAIPGRSSEIPGASNAIPRTSPPETSEGEIRNVNQEFTQQNSVVSSTQDENETSSQRPERRNVSFEKYAYIYSASPSSSSEDENEETFRLNDVIGSDPLNSSVNYEDHEMGNDDSQDASDSSFTSTIDIGSPSIFTVPNSGSSSEEVKVDVPNPEDVLFKESLIGRIEKRRKGLTSMKRDKDDPRKTIIYDPLTDTFSIGGIIVIYEKKGLICSECDKRYEGKSKNPTNNAIIYSLEKAITTHVNYVHLDSFQCTECSRSLSCFYAYQEHMAMHLKNFVCDICGMKAKTRIALKKHKLSHMSEEEKKEWMCAMGKQLESPKPKKNQKKRLECPHCPKKFATAVSVDQHVRMIHLNRKSVECPKCGKVVLEQNFRRYHSVFVCPADEDVERVKCPLCIDTFKNNSSLRNHMKTLHAPERKNRLDKNGKYTCGLCWRTFEKRKALTQHEVAHNRKKNKKMNRRSRRGEEPVTVE